MSYNNYLKLRNQHIDCSIFIKSGVFFCCYQDDAILVNKFFKYHITNHKGYISCSFPIYKIDYVRQYYLQNHISIVIDTNDKFVIHECFPNQYYSYMDNSDFYLGFRSDLYTRIFKKISAFNNSELAYFSNKLGIK